MLTDGSVAVVELKRCEPVSTVLPTASAGSSFKPGNHAFRYLRRQILTFRNDIWRANIIYGTYDVGRIAVKALRPKEGGFQKLGGKDRLAFLRRARLERKVLSNRRRTPMMRERTRIRIARAVALDLEARKDPEIARLLVA